MYFRYIEDLGVAGPDKGKGGKYLVLPPDYKGDVTDGYFVVKSRTYGVWNFIRGYLKDGIDAAVKNIKQNLKVYPLNERRGILTVNETTDYFMVFGDSRDAATVLEVPPGVIIGMMNDMWQESSADVGAFGPNAGAGGTHVIVGPKTPVDAIPEPADWDDDFQVHRISTNQFFVLLLTMWRSRALPVEWIRDARRSYNTEVTTLVI